MIESQKKPFLLAALALAPTVWILSFNYGVYKTVYYEHLFVVWAISLTALICGLVLNLKDERVSFSSWTGRFLLLLPTFWVMSGYWAHLEENSVLVYWVDFILSLLTVFFSLPYIFYHVIFMLVPGVEMIYSTWLIVTLFLITLSISCMGFFVGHYHSHVLSCEDFDVAGNKVPENCWPGLGI